MSTANLKNDQFLTTGKSFLLTDNAGWRVEATDVKVLGEHSLVCNQVPEAGGGRMQFLFCH